MKEKEELKKEKEELKAELKKAKEKANAEAPDTTRKSGPSRQPSPMPLRRTIQPSTPLHGSGSRYLSQHPRGTTQPSTPLHGSGSRYLSPHPRGTTQPSTPLHGSGSRYLSPHPREFNARRYAPGTPHQNDLFRQPSPMHQRFTSIQESGYPPFLPTPQHTQAFVDFGMFNPLLLFLGTSLRANREPEEEPTTRDPVPPSQSFSESTDPTALETGFPRIFTFGT